MTRLNETHDPTLKSWVESANVPGSDFPIQNLPFGVFRRAGSEEEFRGGVAIGDQIVDLKAACNAGVWDGDAAQVAWAASEPTLNNFMALGPQAWSALRMQLFQALREGAAQAERLGVCLVPQAEVEHAVP
ncbi:MAG: fumarylacetoacetase, partial [Burkholderiales bacterium]